jgi:hypothetical protein
MDRRLDSLNLRYDQACKQAEQAEQDPCSVSSRGVGCSARLGLGEQQDARYRSRFGRAESFYARSRLDRDRYRAGLLLGSARSAREFLYVRTSLIRLVAHKIPLWKTINQFRVLQVRQSCSTPINLLNMK